MFRVKSAWSNLPLWPGVAIAMGLLSPPTRAEEGFKVSGFASVVAGETSGSCQSNALAAGFGSNCTRWIADWAHAGLVTDRVSLKPESHAGVQGDWQWSREWSTTVQATARLLENQHANVEWAYLTYSPSPEWKVQVGRKRIPLYYYSDFEDVGFAYNMVRPSPDVYGWEVVNYNGASLSTSRTIGDWHFRLEGYAGGETSRKNPYSALIASDPLDVSWNRLWGTVVEFGRDWFSGRLSYMRSDYAARDRVTSSDVVLPGGATRATQSFFGLALNGDWDEWQWRSEYGTAQRTAATGYRARYFLALLGRQWGDWTLTGGQSGYLESSPYTLAVYVPVRQRTTSAALRWDVHKGGAVKAQFDRVRDAGVLPFTGNARVFSVSYDLVF